LVIIRSFYYNCAGFRFFTNKVISFLQGLPDKENKKLTLTWDYDKKKDKVTGLSIYKNIKGTPPTLWRELNGDVFTLDDKSLKINTEYGYHLIPNLESNSPAKEEVITVVY
jgi:uncharacterized protein